MEKRSETSLFTMGGDRFSRVNLSFSLCLSFRLRDWRDTERRIHVHPNKIYVQLFIVVLHRYSAYGGEVHECVTATDCSDSLHCTTLRETTSGVLIIHSYADLYLNESYEPEIYKTKDIHLNFINILKKNLSTNHHFVFYR